MPIMLGEWVEKNHDEWIFQIGRIGCLSIEIRHSLVFDGKVYSKGEPLGYSIWWHEQDEYVAGEGLAMGYGVTFSMTEAGLKEAKGAAVGWARQLLQEAMSCLPPE